jgi:nicotinate-nucleotide adenylyltransferase
MRIGVLGGAFNPPHIGHLVIAQEAADLLGLDRVYFVPAANPPHKGNGLISGETRYEMVRLALKGNPVFRPSRMELDRGGISYTIDTMREFIGQFGPDCHFITGQDAMEDISSWKSAATLLKTVNFAVAARSGYDQEALAEFIIGALGARYHNLKFKEASESADGRVATIRVTGAETVINILKTPEVGVSSSDIRKRLAGGRSVKYLVPAGVERYLMREQPYSGENMEGDRT